MLTARCFRALYAILDADVGRRRAAGRCPISPRPASTAAPRLLQLRAKHLDVGRVARRWPTRSSPGRAAPARGHRQRSRRRRAAGRRGRRARRPGRPVAVGGRARIVGDRGDRRAVDAHAGAGRRGALDEPIDYIAIGPVFGTATKDTGYDAVGLDLVRRRRDGARGARLPVVAIGGITLERAPAVIAAGAASVAVISDLLATGDPARAGAGLSRTALVRRRV